ncbi:MAG: ABC transporter ATP-binding protein/permease [Burkholderiales bacterium]|nr:ABC transporter ATP-binding protein/permease [Burkholderiales bacterium]
MRRSDSSLATPATSSPHATGHTAPAAGPVANRSDWATLQRLFPYLWTYKWRVMLALGFMVAAKGANVSVPLLLKELVDTMTPAVGRATGLSPGSEGLLIVPLGLLVAYGALRFSTSLFTELRELIFAKATEGATRSIALQVFGHLHALSLRFHLERQTGGMTRDIERGTRGVQSLISYSLYSIVPTLIEVAMVLTLLGTKFEAWYVYTTLGALVLYIFFTVRVTEWRTQFRREMNELDSSSHSKAIDSLLNYETVKYFNNEAFEARRYDESLEKLRKARIKSQTTLSLLNAGQQLIIATALVAMLWRATSAVAAGQMTLGDLVMINAFMIQLYIPLGFLGVLYREIKQSLTDLDKMFTLLEKEREVSDTEAAKPLFIDKNGANPAVAVNGEPCVRFVNVRFGYHADREILHGVSFEIPPGKTVAVVGPSGSGKSTLARLMYRFYDVTNSADGGRIEIAGQDIKTVTQASVRAAIGIVPQDTVLFNDSIEYNIRYGRPDATREEVEAAARAARIHDFIVSLPQGYATSVGERGLKLSGGEKQRVAIARTLLKNPPIVIFDEATSALDSANERAIQAELKTAAANKTTLVIAHRLSTVVDAHEILVLELGTVVERGSHTALLAAGGRYADMWAMQEASGESPDVPTTAVGL